ncbi:MAG: pentachlorophenol monooxygenase [Actinobacteria bacterium]|nr:MAG: pentachlorophenol monooxygenase [Actinomycetota bacterium]
MTDVDVLVVGAGPVGLTVAGELRRRGLACRIIDRLEAPAGIAKAVGIQPRTLEVWEATGVLADALDASTPMLGQKVFVNGQETSEMRMDLPPSVPFEFVSLPQYETERILTEHLARMDTSIERGVELTSFDPDSKGVSAELVGPGGQETVRAQFLVGCDGAHSATRKSLGVEFAGGAFPDEYMLGDVEVDWSMPAGFAIRAMHQTNGQVDDALVCIPLPGHNRYRMSMLVPPELATKPPAEGEVAHGMEAARIPELEHIQAVLDRLAPQATRASNLRWSSLFRISHRIVDRYGDGRVFLAGDAAHIHPPTGAQGMNTGIQDAYNLGWKLGLTLQGVAIDGLLDTYNAERHPVGEEVVGRTVRHARAGFEADPDDPSTVVLREAQLLVGYPDSPLVGDDVEGTQLAEGPRPGQRAPDCRGLRRRSVAFPVRLFELLRGGEHTLLLYAEGEEQAAGFSKLATEATERAARHLHTYVVLAAGVDPAQVLLPTVQDVAGEFRSAYDATGGCGYLIRPDGYVGYRAGKITSPNLLAHLGKTFAG